MEHGEGASLWAFNICVWLCQGGRVFSAFCLSVNEIERKKRKKKKKPAQISLKLGGRVGRRPRKTSAYFVVDLDKWAVFNLSVKRHMIWDSRVFSVGKKTHGS